MTKKLVVFDMDGTVITGNTWLDFNTALGVTKEQDWDLFSAFSDNKIDYQEWLTELIKLYKLEQNKHSKSDVLEYLTQYKLKPEAVATVAAVQAQGHDTLLLTGSFQMTANAVAYELNIPDAIATTRCVFDTDGYLCDIASEGNERQAKVNKLLTFCTAKGYERNDCIIVGDGGNMLDLITQYPNSVVFGTSKQELKQAATHIVSDLTELPDLIESIG